eukprot:5584653-Prymnesium_polylepis.1
MANRATQTVRVGPGAREHPERLPEHARLARSAQRRLRRMPVSSTDVTRNDNDEQRFGLPAPRPFAFR